ncbi:MAG TPA: hypothetical protein VF173_14215 [Thermoanaerobaculia bacterium]|nr:hypothetical protein [Thermoanaerobaculia bacterium]
MIKANLSAVYELGVLLNREEDKWNVSSKDMSIPEEDCDRLMKVFINLLQNHPFVSEEHIAILVAQILARLYGREYTAASLVMQLQDLRVYLENSYAKLVFVPKERADYLEQEQLFGAAVKQSFPSASADIKEAGNCFAVGSFTAAVFHLMRAAESALHVLAEDLGVEFAGGIRYEEWQTIIEKIQIEADKKRANLPNRRLKSEWREFYNGAIGELQAFKDAWRNHVMHARGSYNEQKALSAMNHVQEFMQRLAQKLSEENRAP